MSCGLCCLNTGQPPGITVTLIYTLDILLVAVISWNQRKWIWVRWEKGLVAVRLQISTNKNKSRFEICGSEIWAQYQRGHLQPDVHTTRLFLMICPWLLSSSVQPPQIIPTDWLALVLACQLSWTDSRSQWNSRSVEWMIDFSQLHKGHAQCRLSSSIN